MLPIVAILRGGPSSEYEVSLNTGKSMLKALSTKYVVKDIVVDKNGDWYEGGLRLLPAQALGNADVVLIAMHGEYGEDGKVQQILESMNMPFSGSSALGSAIAIDKNRSKSFYTEYGLRTPLHIFIDNSEDMENKILDIFRRVPPPFVVKPVSLGSSVGVSVISSFHDLSRIVGDHLNNGTKVIVEEYIDGKEGTIGVIENFRNKNLYSLLPVEIVVDKGFFDYNAKYCGTTTEICPGSFSRKESEEMQEMAKRAHQILNQRHYSRSDFRIHPRRGIYILETNSLPGMTEASLFPKALNAVGVNYGDFLDHLINLALTRK